MKPNNQYVLLVVVRVIPLLFRSVQFTSQLRKSPNAFQFHHEILYRRQRKGRLPFVVVRINEICWNFDVSYLVIKDVTLLYQLLLLLLNEL